MKRTVRDEWRHYLRRPSSSAKPDAVTTSEIDKVLGDITAGTAPGYDCIHPEFLTHMGPQVRNRLAKFFSCLLTEHRIPCVWRQANVIALPKPGKDITLAASYRLISLLIVCFKLLERIILRRIAPTVDAVLSPSQAGSRQGRSTNDQVCAVWRSIDRLRSFRFTYVLKLQLEPMDLNSKIKLTFLLLQLGTSNLRHS